MGFKRFSATAFSRENWFRAKCVAIILLIAGPFAFSIFSPARAVVLISGSIIGLLSVLAKKENCRRENTARIVFVGVTGILCILSGFALFDSISESFSSPSTLTGHMINGILTVFAFVIPVGFFFGILEGITPGPIRIWRENSHIISFIALFGAGFFIIATRATIAIYILLPLYIMILVFAFVVAAIFYWLGCPIGIVLGKRLLYLGNLKEVVSVLWIPLGGFIVGLFVIGLIFGSIYGVLWKIDTDSFSNRCAADSLSFMDIVLYSMTLLTPFKESCVAAHITFVRVLGVIEAALGLAWTVAAFAMILIQQASNIERMKMRSLSRNKRNVQNRKGYRKALRNRY